jgi:2-polyprenyl-6-methoxyphenol hydroxylase-like FAD-dependent oxidoreductase
VKHRLVADNPPERFRAERNPTIEEWQEVVNQRSSVPMQLTDPDWTANFRVSSRMVEHVRRGRVFLMGDAAHIHSPALAQGMNTGIQDAWNLAWKLSLVQKSLSALSLLDSYEKERMPVSGAAGRIHCFQVPSGALKIASSLSSKAVLYFFIARHFLHSEAVSFLPL